MGKTVSDQTIDNPPIEVLIISDIWCEELVVSLSAWIVQTVYSKHTATYDKKYLEVVDRTKSK